MKNIRKARVLLALDILSAITITQTMDPMGGKVFGSALNSNIEEQYYRDGGVSAREFLRHLIKTGVKCTVCAKGAFVIAHVLRFNKMDINDLSNLSTSSDENELPEFDAKMMAELETLFEGTVYSWNRDILSNAEQTLLTEYHENHLERFTEKNRLIQIMTLLLMSGGREFVLKR